MISKVFEFMEQYHMIDEKDLVVLGVSGGADSLCLFSVLLEYRKIVDFFPVVVHVNHQLRPEAVEEARYVKELCEKEKIPFYLKEVKVDELARQKKISVEEAGRIVRYQAFEEAAGLYDRQEAAGKKIAVAHHGGDQAETMLFHLFRGTGVCGMAGIMPVRGRIIRPLLVLTRDKIEEYLRSRGIGWCHDKSNDEDCYSRNKIRHHILEYAKREINERAVEHTAQAAMQMGQLREYLQQQVEQAEKKCCQKKEEAMLISIHDFFLCHKFLQGQLLLKVLAEISPGRKDIGEIHIHQLLELMNKEGSKQLHLPGGIRAIKEYGILRLERKKIPVREGEEKDSLKAQKLQEGIYPMEEGKVLEIKLLTRQDFFSIQENQYTKYLDYGKINNCLSLRNRQTGDYIVINHQGQRKSVKDYMIQEKIPKALRNHIPVVAEGHHVLWIIGYRISAYYKISENTETILQMKIKRRE